METETKHWKESCTKGDWKQNGNNGVHTQDGNCIALTYRNSKSDALLIAESGTVLNQCGLTPSELLQNRNELAIVGLETAEDNLKLRKQRDELLEALKPFAEFAKEYSHMNHLPNGRPKTGELYGISFTSDKTVAITVEDLNNALTALQSASKK